MYHFGFSVLAIIVINGYTPVVSEVRPQFGPITSNVTATVGDDVALHCSVLYQGDSRVSWIRHKDLNLLTVGSLTYTADRRISVENDGHNWILKINPVMKKDAGTYECQISTTPPMGKTVDLYVRDKPRYTSYTPREEVYSESNSSQLKTSILLIIFTYCFI